MCTECRRLRRAFAEACRLNIELSALLINARADPPDVLHMLREASRIADERWQQARAELAAHVAEHSSDQALTPEEE